MSAVPWVGKLQAALQPSPTKHPLRLRTYSGHLYGMKHSAFDSTPTPGDIAANAATTSQNPAELDDHSHSPHPLQDFQKLNSQFDRVEASFQAIASQHKLAHRRLLALNWASRYHGIPAGTFQKAFEMWLESNTEGGES